MLHFSIFSAVHQNKEAFLTKLRLYSIKLIVIYPHRRRESNLLEKTKTKQYKSAFNFFFEILMRHHPRATSLFIEYPVLLVLYVFPQGLIKKGLIWNIFWLKHLSTHLCLIQSKCNSLNWDCGVRGSSFRVYKILLERGHAQ